MTNLFSDPTILQNKIPLSPAAKEFQDYLTDFSQRSVLFMDIMRKRGNQAVEMSSNNGATVLSFDFEILMDGATFSRPINYWLAKMQAPAGVVTDDTKRPFVIQDPRAGQSPGIGGMKKDSEIGDALKNGHPVYFVGFNAAPIEGQTYEDVIKGQVAFYEKIAELHPESPKMCAMGNCAAGYLTMFNAMQRPDLFGPIVIAGSPLSYWNGVRGKNPMRYAGGLLGGSWINSLLGDLGGGKFDGSYLIENFNNLNPANTLWSKQYNLFADIDNQGERYLQFERWWGDFIQFNTSEIKWLVDKLFIGNELTTGNLTLEDGTVLDPRAITSPLITFVSDGDNISPPAQSAGWIADLYHDADEIREHGKTIIYCLNHKVGHLAIFTASKVGKREDELFVENIDSIDIMPPGLYELVIDTPEGQEVSGELRSHYEPRSIDDIKALGWNNQEDDRAFATAAKASQSISQIYDKMVHPLFKNFATPQIAALMKNLHPLRQSYSIFAESVNPWIKIFADLASKVNAQRVHINPDNQFLKLQQQYSDAIVHYLETDSAKQDLKHEKKFFDIWTNPLVQKFWGTDKITPRLTPSITQLDREQITHEAQQRVIDNLPVTNQIQAMYRIIRLIIAFREQKIVPELLVRVLVQEAHKLEPTWNDREIHEVIRNQAIVVAEDTDAAIAALKTYLETNENGHAMIEIVREVSTKLGGIKQADVHEALKVLVDKLGLKISNPNHKK